MINTTLYKERLEASLEKITTALSELAAHDAATDDWTALPTDPGQVEADENIEADQAEAWDERQATVAVLETDYRNVKRALQKIADGTYGICEISGEPIEVARLDALPEARTCITHREEEATLTL